MNSNSLLAFVGLAVVSVGLFAGAVRMPQRVQPPLTGAALYEEQVEEGFGRLDQLPKK